MIWTLIITFVCGAAYECGCVFWVHHSEKGNGFRAAAWSMFNALVTCVGLGAALHQPLFILVYVLGFGAGTYLAIKYKSYLHSKMR